MQPYIRKIQPLVVTQNWSILISVVDRSQKAVKKPDASAWLSEKQMGKNESARESVDENDFIFQGLFSVLWALNRSTAPVKYVERKKKLRPHPPQFEI